MSALLALIYVIVAAVTDGAWGAFITVAFIILPLARIWFGNEMGDFQGIAFDIGITAPSPVIVVCITGWLLLSLPIVILVLERFS